MKTKIFNFGCFSFLILSMILAGFSACSNPSSPDLVNGDVMFTVTFDAKGGDPVPNPILVPMGSRIKIPENVKKIRYSLFGWYTDEVFKEKWDFNRDIVTEDITLHALWRSSSGGGGGGGGVGGGNGGVVIFAAFSVSELTPKGLMTLNFYTEVQAGSAAPAKTQPSNGDSYEETINGVIVSKGTVQVTTGPGGVLEITFLPDPAFGATNFTADFTTSTGTMESTGGTGFPNGSGGNMDIIGATSNGSFDQYIVSYSEFTPDGEVLVVVTQNRPRTAAGPTPGVIPPPEDGDTFEIYENGSKVSEGVLDVAAGGAPNTTTVTFKQKTGRSFTGTLTDNVTVPLSGGTQTVTALTIPKTTAAPVSVGGATAAEDSNGGIGGVIVKQTSPDYKMSTPKGEVEVYFSNSSSSSDPVPKDGDRYEMVLDGKIVSKGYVKVTPGSGGTQIITYVPDSFSDDPATGDPEIHGTFANTPTGGSPVPTLEFTDPLPNIPDGKGGWLDDIPAATPQGGGIVDPTSVFEYDDPTYGLVEIVIKNPNPATPLNSPPTTGDRYEIWVDGELVSRGEIVVSGGNVTYKPDSGNTTTPGTGTGVVTGSIDPGPTLVIPSLPSKPNGGSPYINVSATPSGSVPAGALSLPTGPISLGSDDFGYTASHQQSVTITNSWAGKVPVSVTISGSSFELAIPIPTEVLAGGTAAIKVQPITGLTSGTYTETITVTYDGKTETVTVTFTVNALDPLTLFISSGSPFSASPISFETKTTTTTINSSSSTGDIVTETKSGYYGHVMPTPQYGTKLTGYMANGNWVTGAWKKGYLGPYVMVARVDAGSGAQMINIGPSSGGSIYDDFGGSSTPVATYTWRTDSISGGKAVGTMVLTLLDADYHFTAGFVYFGTSKAVTDAINTNDYSALSKEILTLDSKVGDVETLKTGPISTSGAVKLDLNIEAGNKPPVFYPDGTKPFAFVVGTEQEVHVDNIGNIQTVGNRDYINFANPPESGTEIFETLMSGDPGYPGIEIFVDKSTTPPTPVTVLTGIIKTEEGYCYRLGSGPVPIYFVDGKYYDNSTSSFINIASPTAVTVIPNDPPPSGTGTFHESTTMVPGHPLQYQDTTTNVITNANYKYNLMVPASPPQKIGEVTVVYTRGDAAGASQVLLNYNVEYTFDPAFLTIMNGYSGWSFTCNGSSKTGKPPSPPYTFTFTSPNLTAKDEPAFSIATGFTYTP